ncbi:MAG: nuclear transport factor 2 family protein [Verrucomicrobia bacterium]|nr:nuclear transport factor 2 family protein [Verrucomicrobiota bacterium]
MNRDEEIAIEWDCQKVLRQYYHYVDQKEYEKAAELFTPDVEWSSMSVVLKGRDDIIKGLHGSLGGGTIRHVFTNTVVEVIDENHAVSRSYNTNYYTRGVRIEDRDEPIPFSGPHRVSDNDAELVRTDDGWKISRRRMGHVFRHNPEERVGLEIWGEDAGKMEKPKS